VLELTCVHCSRRFVLYDFEAWLALRSQTQGIDVTCGCRATR
jgi:hypothetical protein